MYLNVYKVYGKDVYVEFFSDETAAKDKAAALMREIIQKKKAEVKKDLYLYGETYPREDGIMCMSISLLEDVPMEDYWLEVHEFHTIKYDKSKTYLIYGVTPHCSEPLFSIEEFDCKEAAQLFVQNEIAKLEDSLFYHVEESYYVENGEMVREEERMPDMINRKGNLEDLLSVSISEWRDDYREYTHYFKLV